MAKRDYDEIIRNSLNLSKQQEKEASAYKFNDIVITLLFTIITIALIIKVYVFEDTNEIWAFIFIIITVISYINAYRNYVK